MIKQEIANKDLQILSEYINFVEKNIAPSNEFSYETQFSRGRLRTIRISFFYKTSLNYNPILEQLSELFSVTLIDGCMNNIPKGCKTIYYIDKSICKPKINK